MSLKTRRDEQHLTVGRLRQLLLDLPDDMLVMTEGCDCVGPSDGVEVSCSWEGGDRLIVNRNDGIKDWEDAL